LLPLSGLGLIPGPYCVHTDFIDHLLCQRKSGGSADIGSLSAAHTDYEQAQEDLEMEISRPNGTNLSDWAGYATPIAAQIAAHFLDITLLAAGRPVIVVKDVSDGVTVVGVASPAVEYRPLDLEPLSDAPVKQPPRLLE
jgi:hypothetical protein